MQWYRTPTSEEALTVQPWACSACGSGDASWWFSNRCSSSPKTQIAHVSDIISSPHSPFKSLIRLLLLSHGRRSATPDKLPAQCQGAHLQHGTGQRSASGGRAPSRGVGSPVGGASARLAARRRSSARRAAAVIALPRGGRRRLAARRWPCAALTSRAGILLFGGWLWVLRDDRNGCSRPSGPEATATRIARAQPR